MSNTEFHVAEIQRMSAENLYLLIKHVNSIARVMDASDPEQFKRDFDRVWSVTKETKSVIAGLEPKQEVGAQLVININDLPGIADAMQRPRVDGMAHLTIDAEVIDAPEPKFGASTVQVTPAENVKLSYMAEEVDLLDGETDIVQAALEDLESALDDFEFDPNTSYS